jgi:hypothetical protein
MTYVVGDQVLGDALSDLERDDAIMYINLVADYADLAARHVNTDDDLDREEASVGRIARDYYSIVIDCVPEHRVQYIPADDAIAWHYVGQHFLFAAIDRVPDHALAARARRFCSLSIA